MPIRFQCSQCGAGFKAANMHSGQQVPCPKCGSAMQVPATQATLAPPDDPLDETESSGLTDTLVSPLASAAKRAVEGSNEVPPPPPPPIAAKPQASEPANAFQSPAAPSESPRELDLTRVKITDIDLPIRSVFKLTLKFWLVTLVFGFALWLISVLLLFAFLATFGPGVMAP